jgi:hypothetical protein
LFHPATDLLGGSMADSETSVSSPGSWVLVAVTWALVAVPLLWGIWTTLAKSAVLFR